MAKKIRFSLLTEFQKNLSKLKFGEKVLFQILSHFPRKMILYPSTKLCFFEPFSNIQSLRKFELGFR